MRVVHCGQGSCGALCVCGFSLFHSRSVIIDTWKGGLRNPSGCALVMRNLSFLTTSLLKVLMTKSSQAVATAVNSVVALAVAESIIMLHGKPASEWNETIIQLGFDSCKAVSAQEIAERSLASCHVAAFDLGVRPIGDWSISITLSRCSMPSTDLCRPIASFDL